MKEKTDRYILVNKLPVPEPDLLTWARWLENSENRIVDKTQLSDDTSVSTVFLGIDHSFGWGDGGKPILFETMVFRNGEGGDCERYSTWSQAVKGHKEMVEKVREEMTRSSHEKS